MGYGPVTAPSLYYSTKFTLGHEKLLKFVSVIMEGLPYKAPGLRSRVNTI